MIQEKNTSSFKTAGILSLIILGACLLIFQSYIFGNETFVFGDIGSDTKQQYLMQYNTIVNHLRNGSFSLWDFNNGFGVNMFGLNLTDPFLMVLYLLGVVFGPEHLASYLVYFQIFKILLAGIAVYYYLSCFSLSEYAKLIAGFMYAFSGFMVVWGQHYQFATVVVFFPLLLLCIEKTLVCKKYKLILAAVSGIIVFGSLYWGYMCLLGGGIYLCFRLIQLNGWKLKEKIMLLFSDGCFMLLGVGMGAINLFPVAALLFGTSARLASTTSLSQRLLASFSLWPKDYYKTALYNLFSSNLQSGSTYSYSGFSNYYEDIHLFLSTLFVILLFQYLFTIHRQNTDKKHKITQYAAVILIAVSIGLKCGSIIFNGFSYEFSRHSFLFMPLFALVSGMMLDRIIKERKLNILGLAAACIGIIAVYGKAYTYLKEAGYGENAFFMLVTGIGMAVVLWLFVQKKWKIPFSNLYLMLVVLLFFNVTSDTALNYKNRDTVKKDDTSYFEGTYHSSVEEALAYLKSIDSSFYRVEKDFISASHSMDSLAQYYHGVSTYNSTQNGNIAAFVDRVWPQLYSLGDINHYQFKNAVHDSDLAALCNVKYILTKTKDLNVDGYQFLREVGDIYIYRNQKTSSLGKFFTKTMEEDAFTAKRSQFDVEGLLSEVLVLDESESQKKSAFRISDKQLKEYQKKKAADLIAYDKIDMSVCQGGNHEITTYDQHFIHLPVNQKTLQKYQRAKLEFTIEVDFPTYVEISTNDDRPYRVYVRKDEPKNIALNILPDTENITIQINEGKVNAKLTNLNAYGYKDSIVYDEEANIEITDPKRDSMITGKIEAPVDGMVMLAIPFEKGWSVYLDGNRQEIKRADYGFIAFETPAGSHEVKIVFEPPLFKEGVIVSIISSIIFISMLVWNIRISRNRKEE